MLSNQENPVGAWMAGTNPAMTQSTEFKGDRHARPCAGYPREANGMAAFAEIRGFFRSLLDR